MSEDTMTAAESAAWLADIAPRRVCVMCGAINPPTVPGAIGCDAVDLHDGCGAEWQGRVDAEVGTLRHEDAVRALRGVVALHAAHDAAWLAGAAAARAADVAALRVRTAERSASVGALLAAAEQEPGVLRVAMGGEAEAVCALAEVGALPLPPPPGSPPAPAQRPEAGADGATGREGAATPAEGCYGAAEQEG